ncbi:hypothetical protein V6N13_134136 [Hibiscus sabdariffa]
MGGDFNIIRNPEEKLGITIQKGAMADFSNFIDELSLIHLPANGEKFLITTRPHSAKWGPKPFKWFDNMEVVNQLKTACHISKLNQLKQRKNVSKAWESKSSKADAETIRSLESKCQALELEISNRMEPVAKTTLLINDAQKDDIWCHVWSSCAPSKVAACVWLAVHGRLPTKVELYKRGCLHNASLLCPLCEIATETANHLFCDCLAGGALLSGHKMISILMLAKGYKQIRATVKSLDPFPWWGC